MADIKETILTTLGLADDSGFSLPLEKVGIDSIDLVALRVNLDSLSGHEISDQHWLNIRTLEELNRYYSRFVPGIQTVAASREAETNEKRYMLNMPQMALGSLSENWMFKETGDFHWYMLCQGLQEQSNSIFDDAGNRLYATFVRIRWEGNTHLRGFQENDIFTMHCDLSRFGKGMYFSDIAIRETSGKSIDINMMTTFSFREHTDNSKLAKGQPASKVNHIRENSAMPEFGETYRAFRKGELTAVQLHGVNFPVSKDYLWEMNYQIHPYIDLNGVNLLYFAAYPTISDYCENLYFNQRNHAPPATWAGKAFTIARDIFYMANCNMDDEIGFKIHQFEYFETDKIRITTSLTRKSDDRVLAYIFTVKQILPE